MHTSCIFYASSDLLLLMGGVRTFLRYSVEEEELLEATYQKNGPKFSHEMFENMAATLGYTKKQMRNWFNRRRERDENIPPKRRFTPAQREILEAAYLKNKTPTRAQEEKISEKLKIDDVNRIRNWFQAKRYPTMKLKTPAFLYTREQKVVLIAFYLKNKYPSDQEYDELAEEVGVPTERLRAWFSSRRCQVTRYGWNAEQEKFVLDAYQENRKPWANPVGATLSPTTSKILEDAFEVNQQPTSEELQNLQEKTKLDVSRINLWFDRKRLGMKKQATKEKLKSQEQFNSICDELYPKNKYRTTKELNELADQIGVDRLRLRCWFRYRRIKDKEYKPHVPIVKPLIRRTHEEIIALEKEYQKNKRPDLKEAGEIADRIGIKTSQVRGWFQRKRIDDEDCKKRKIHHDPSVVEVFQAAYQKNPRPSVEEREDLAEIVGLTSTQVSSWFSSARARFGCPTIKTANLTTEQKDVLLNAFSENPYPSVAKKEELANCTGLTRKRISNWFSDAKKSKRKKSKVAIQSEQEEDSITKVEDVEVKIKLEHTDTALCDKDQDMH